MQEQLLYYCWLDVEDLAEIVRKFRDSHLHFADEMDSELPGGWKATNIDPFDFLTQSEVAKTFFSRGHVHDESNENLPAISAPKKKRGWSSVSLEWMEYEAKRCNIHIQHMGNSFKEFFDPFSEAFVDGYCKDTNTVYEFYGCYWHGCPRCYDRTKVHDRKNLPMYSIYGETMKKKSTLSQHYNVVTMWECFWSEIRDSYVTEYEKRGLQHFS